MREQLDKTIEGVGGMGDSLGFQAAALKLVSYREQKDFKKALDEALATSATLTTLDPDSRYTYNLMTAELYTMNEDNAQAIALCASLLDRQDATPTIVSSAIQRLVQIHMQQNDAEGAIRVCENYLEAYPDSPLKLNLLTNIGFLYQRAENQEMADQKFDEAEKQIQTNIDKALVEDEKSFWLINLARLQRDRGRMDDVRQTLDTIISEYPLSANRSQAMMMRAELDVSLEKYDEAISILENVAKDYANERPAAQAVQMIDQIRAQMLKPASALATTGTTLTTGTLPTAAISDIETMEEAPVMGDEPTSGAAIDQEVAP
jgi:TolA-binding protein